jgi:hypothetical protein
MRLFARAGSIGAAIIVLAASAGAQYRGNPYYDRDDDRGAYPDIGAYRGGIVERTLSDLDRSRYAARGWRGNWKEMDKARNDLVRFRENWMRGRFDRDRIDGAIHHLDRVVDSGGLPPRERDLLARDLFDLRDFRSVRRAPYGYPGGPRRY